MAAQLRYWIYLPRRTRRADGLRASRFEAFGVERQNGSADDAD